MLKAKRNRFVHSIPAYNTNVGTEKRKKRSKIAKEFKCELKEILLDNVEDRLVGHLTEAHAMRGADIVDFYVLY